MTVTCSVMCLFLAPSWVGLRSVIVTFPGTEVIKHEFVLKLKIKRNDWLLAITCPQVANHCYFILSLRLYSSFITSGPGHTHLLYNSL